MGHVKGEYKYLNNYTGRNTGLENNLYFTRGWKSWENNGKLRIWESPGRIEMYEQILNGCNTRLENNVYLTRGWGNRGKK